MTILKLHIHTHISDVGMAVISAGTVYNPRVGIFSVFCCCLININDKRHSFIKLLSQDLFHGSNTDTHVFH